MKNTSAHSINISIGQFNIGANDLVFVDLVNKYNRYYMGKHLDFLNKKDRMITPLEMLTDLKSRGIEVSDEVKELIESGFFNKTIYEFNQEAHSKIVLVKGPALNFHTPSVIIRDGLPNEFLLIPSDLTFQLTWILSHFLSKEFLGIHNIYHVFIMSNPLADLSQKGSQVILEWNPNYSDKGMIETSLYDNVHTGGYSSGYLFFTY